jgi:hypothetical protein
VCGETWPKTDIMTVIVKTAASDGVDAANMVLVNMIELAG